MKTLIVLAAFVFAGCRDRQPEVSTPPSPSANQTATQAKKAQPQAAALPDIRKRREQESRMLNEYAWVDRDAGIARIPVDRAMRILIERGVLGPPPAALSTADQSQ